MKGAAAQLLSVAGALLVCAGAVSCVNLDDPPLLGENVGRSSGGQGNRCGQTPADSDRDLVMHFIDVGQGDAIWIETPDDGDYGNGEREGFDILIDSGPIAFGGGGPATGEALIDYLSSHGKPPGTPIDFFILTHAHADHYGGAVELMDQYDVINVMDPGFVNDENSTYLAFLERAADEVVENGGQLYIPLVGTLVGAEYEAITLFGSELEVAVLNSESTLRQGDSRDDQINNTSISLSMGYGGVTALLMGDSYVDNEADIIAALPDLQANILKVGHHGSTSSTSTDFLEHIFDGVGTTRRVAVIESGRQSFSGVQLPAESTLARLLDYVPSTSMFSTELGDEGTESEAPGDDHVQVVIREDGQIVSCYVN